MPASFPVSQDIVTISVDNRHCHLFGVCQQEAPRIFNLDADGRLRYDAHPSSVDADSGRQAARLCPMQAITVTEKKT